MINSFLRIIPLPVKSNKKPRNLLQGSIVMIYFFPSRQSTPIAARLAGKKSLIDLNVSWNKYRNKYFNCTFFDAINK
jgi:hypothetical protein